MNKKTETLLTAILNIMSITVSLFLLFVIMSIGCSITAQEPDGPTVIQRQLDQCKLDLQVCRSGK